MVVIPDGHAVHAWLLALVPAVLTYVPAAQSLHAVQLAAFSVVLNVPDAQPAHARSLVAVPSLVTYCPALQLVHAMHALS